MNIVDWYRARSAPVQYGIPIAGSLGLGGLAYGLMNQGQQQTVPMRTNSAPAVAPAPPEYVLDQRGLPYSVYGQPLSQDEALAQAAKLAQQMEKVPQQRAKEIRQMEIEARLLALQEEAVKNQYLS